MTARTTQAINAFFVLLICAMAFIAGMSFWSEQLANDRQASGIFSGQPKVTKPSAPLKNVKFMEVQA